MADATRPTLLRRIFGYENAVSGVELVIKNPDRTGEATDAILGLRLPNILVRSWQQSFSDYFNALETERHVMFLILTLIIIVAAFNIISSLVMMVKDKTQAIAILRTMGATRGTILRVFLIVGASIGVVGTLGGLALGLLVCANIQSIQDAVSWASGTNLWDPTVRFLTQIPADIDRGETVAVICMALTLSLLATLYPSWRAAALDPIDALRYE